MARRVFFHVGTLKTGTTYLQRVLWENRAALEAAGLVVAGEYYSDRVWASETVRGMTPRAPRGLTAWDRIVGQVNRFPGDAVISHEFFGGATREQAEQAKARLEGAEIHVVVTVRDLIGILPAFWQEQVKFGYTGRFSDYDPLGLDAPPARHWSWRTIDAADVLSRWATDVPADRVHVVTVPKAGSPRGLLWERFASVCGFDPAVASLDLPPVNESMGVVEGELLRRVNEGLADELRKPGEPARWLRGYLGLEILAQREGEKLRVSPERAKELRERGQAIADAIAEAGYHVVGDLADIVGPTEPPTSRQPEEIGADELLDAALATINTMLVDHRRISVENARLRRRKADRGAVTRRAKAAVIRRGGRGLRALKGLRARLRRR